MVRERSVGMVEESTIRQGWPQPLVSPLELRHLAVEHTPLGQFYQVLAGPRGNRKLALTTSSYDNPLTTQKHQH